MALNDKQYTQKVTDNIKILLDGFYHNETGESVDTAQINVLVEEIMNGRLDLTTSDVEISRTNVKHYKYVNDKRRFLRLLITNYNNLDISYKLEGILSRFSKNIRQDGSGVVDIENRYSIKSLAEYFGVKPQTLSKMLNELQSKGAIKTEKVKQSTYIYLNPDIVRFGNIITEKLKNMFSIEGEYLQLIDM